MATYSTVLSCLDFRVLIVQPINEVERTGFGASLWVRAPRLLY